MYLAAIVAFPVLHRLHHLAHGADHVHTAAGTIWLHDEDHDHDDDHDVAHYHAELDATLAHLGLAEVAFAGTLTVDCTYSAYTLATCDETATPDHARTFGDDLLARTHHQHHDEGAEHGAGSIEHAQAHYLCAAPIVLPPRVDRLVRLSFESHYEAPHLPFRTTSDARGPPARA